MIRKLRWGDFDDLVSNYYSYYDELRESNADLGLIFYDTKPDYASEVAWFSTLFSDTLRGNAIAMVSEEDGHVVGICDVHRERPGSDVSHKGVLGMAIREDYRGKGIGTELLKAAIDQCRGHLDLIVLSVFSNNTNAVQLYSKAGFQKYGELGNSIKRNGKYYTELLMCYSYI